MATEALSLAEAVPAGNLNGRAAAYVLNRLGYGPRPGDIGRITHLGVDRYIRDQLEPGRDLALEQRLHAAAPYVEWSLDQTYDHWQLDIQSNRRDADPAKRTNYIAQLNTQFRSAQVVRAAHSENQLLERMTWFWMNHFNVNLPDDIVRYTIHDYERQLRRHALGKFKDLLSASAHHPAMMVYLDNNLSTVSRYDGRGRLLSGLNENYGRELMELHTLGVDAGYTQDHVYNAAVILTGWGVTRGRLTFEFNPGNHDPRATEVFGYSVPAGQMQESGEGLLSFLAAHPKTAEHISRKLVQYFVADDPPPALVSRAAQRYLARDGDIAEVLRVIFASNEFWAGAFAPGRYKDPFDFVASTLRALDADVMDGRNVGGPLSGMGQPQYNCIPPTGWTLRAAEWVNPASHLNRMNFALDLVSRLTNARGAPAFEGIHFDLGRLLLDHRVSGNRASSIVAFFNEQIFGGRLSAATVAAAGAVGSRGSSLPLANRVAGLLMASPEAQER